MTRRRFEGLRREAVRRLIAEGIKKNGRFQHDCKTGKIIEIKMGRALNMDHVDWSKTKCRSYAEVWESMMPLRELIGME